MHVKRIENVSNTYLTITGGTTLLSVNTLSNVTVILAPNASSPLLTTNTGISIAVVIPDTIPVAPGITLPSSFLHKQGDQSIIDTYIHCLFDL